MQPSMLGPKSLHRHTNPTNYGFWNPPLSPPQYQSPLKVGSSRLVRLHYWEYDRVCMHVCMSVKYVPINIDVCTPMGEKPSWPGQL